MNEQAMFKIVDPSTLSKQELQEAQTRCQEDVAFLTPIYRRRKHLLVHVDMLLGKAIRELHSVQEEILRREEKIKRLPSDPDFSLETRSLLSYIPLTMRKYVFFRCSALVCDFFLLFAPNGCACLHCFYKPDAFRRFLNKGFTKKCF